jgi:DNA-binding transcriptional LysR family regulator
MNMNLSQLRYAKAVAETGSFTLAAEQCHVTQPSLSNGIAQLEQEFEERLFTRSTRQVTLTPFGKHILPFIDKVLGAQAELLGEVRNYAHPSRAVVRIGTSPLIRANWLVRMLEKYRQAHPDVEIILHEQNMADLYRMLEDGLLDFVFGVIDVPKPSWRRAFLYREPLYFVPRGEKFPERGETVTFKEIAGETFVMVPNVCGLARATRAIFRSHRRKLNEYSGEALGYSVLEEWACLGLGAAILPKSKLQLSQRKAYIITDNGDQELALDFEAVWMHATPRPAHLQEFEEFLEGYRETAV